MESLNVKNINDEKIFNVIDPNGQGEVVNRIRPISISINQKAETINDETDSTVNLSVYWNDTWKSILDLTFNDSLRQEYGKLTEDLTKIQKDIDMKQYKDAETKTSDFLKYVANLSSKYTAIPETQNVAASKNKFITIKAERNSVKATISDKLLNFMLKKFAKVNDLDYTKANECYRINRNSCIANDIALYFHSPELFQKQAYMTVVKDNKVVGSYKATYDQFCKLASKFDVTPQKLGYSKDKLAGYMKTAEVVMQNIFFDSVDEAKEWQEMVDEKKKEQADIPEGEETETTETTETETKTTMEEGKSESPAKEEGGLARPSEDFASDEIPESQPRQQEQMGQGMAASRRLNLLKKRALRKKSYTVEENKKVLKELEDMLKNKDQYYSHETIKKLIKEIKREIELQQSSSKIKNVQKKAGTGNFKTYDNYPLIAIGDDDVYSIKDFVNNYNEENEDKITEEEVLKSSALMEMYNDDLTIYYQDYIDEMRSAIDRKDTPYHEIGIKGGYYEGLQLIVNEKDEDFYNDYDNDHWEEYSKYWDNGEELTEEYKKARDAAWDKECEKVAKIMEELGKEQGWGEYAVAYRMSNGETGYTKVNANKKELKLKRKANLKKKAIEGDVQEQDIVPAKIETKVYLQSEDKKKEYWEDKFFHEGYKKGKETAKNSIEKYDLDNAKNKEQKGIVGKNLDKEQTENYLFGFITGYNEIFREKNLNNKSSKKTNVKKQAEETIEEKIELDNTIKWTIGVGDTVAIKVDNCIWEDMYMYADFIGKPLILMENDKEDINKVIVEQTEYPFQRMSIDKDKIMQYSELKVADVIVEDVDGDEMITTFEELPVVAKQCKIKSIHKAARIGGK